MLNHLYSNEYREYNKHKCTRHSRSPIYAIGNMLTSILWNQEHTTNIYFFLNRDICLQSTQEHLFNSKLSKIYKSIFNISGLRLAAAVVIMSIFIIISLLMSPLLEYRLSLWITHKENGPSAHWWVLTTANTARSNGLTCLLKHREAGYNKFLVIQAMTDQRCLTSAIVRRAH
jgi:hypothetical protein